MLVFYRKKMERVLIGDDIEIVVVETHRGGVKLAISAPKHVTILRAEVDDRPNIKDSTHRESRWRFEDGHLIAPEAGAKINLTALLAIIGEPLNRP
jgi:carbon storage regulator CsrA